MITASGFSIRNRGSMQKLTSHPISSSAPGVDPNLGTVQSALAFHQQGKLIEAKKLYEEILRKDPAHFDSLHLSGVLSYQLDAAAEAEKFFLQALHINKNYAPLYANYGLALHRLNRFDEALEYYERAISVKSDYADAFSNRAYTLVRLKRFDEALECYNKAILIKPDHAAVFNNRANMLKEQKRFDEALESYSKALLIKPDFPDVFYNRGNTFRELKRFDDALQDYEQAIAIKPDYAIAFNNRGTTLKDLKRLHEAFASFNQATLIQSDYAEAFYNRGAILDELKIFDPALVSYDNAILNKPDYAEAFFNRGNTLRELQRFDEAVQSYDIAILIKSDYEKVFNNRGATLQDLKRFDEALLSYNKALSIKPDYADALNNRGNTLKELKRFDEALHSYDEAIKNKPNNFDAQSNRLFTLSYTEYLSASSRLAEARNFGSNVARVVARKFNSWNVDKLSGKLRIGFVSGDFRNHPVAFFLERFLDKLDSKKFNVIAYTNHSQQDFVTLRLRSFFSCFQEIFRFNDEETANLIHSDNLNILIDLSGHTAFNRLPVFAYRPAPIQISWLGYCASTGVEEIDFIIGDPYVTPQIEEVHFSERIKRLPETYLCFTPPDVDVQPNDLPAIKNGYVTFGCFSNFTKVNRSVIELWAKILLAVDGSKLFLKAAQLGDSYVIAETVALFAFFGVTSERLIFEGRTDKISYFKSYNRIDIVLDPFPFPGATTSAQALWMGVPVLTKKGNRFISHNGETIAHNSGQADWIAENDSDYIEKAIRFSSNIQGLAKLRSGLRAQVLASPLFDADRFARNFEKAMLEIWEDYSSGKQNN